MVGIALFQFKPNIIDDPHGRLIIFGLALIAVIGLIFSSIFDRNEAKTRNKLEDDTRRMLADLSARSVVMARQQTESDRRFQELAGLIPKASPAPPAPIDKPISAPDIRGKVRDLAHDLFAFLKEQGPGPKVGRDETKETLREYMARIWRELGPWVTSIHNGYDSRFRQRIEDLIQELSDNGITDTGIEQWEVNPPNGQNDERIRAIAEKLYILAARMDIKFGEEESQ